jgi:hypothetical protein
MRRLTRTAFSRLLMLIGLGCLLLGAMLYLLTRTQLPILLSPLAIPHPILRSTSTWFLSLPSALHALAFSALLGAATGASRKSIAAAGLFLLLLNIFWELSCHPMLGLVHTVSHSVAQHFNAQWRSIACTFDMADIVAAALGALVPSLLHGLVGPAKNLPDNDLQRRTQNA